MEQAARRPRLTVPLYRLYERRLLRQLDLQRLPRHIGIILDGHRRYARAEGLDTYTDSYRSGMRRFEDFLGWAAELPIPSITAWVLSTENLGRPAEQIEPYFDTLIEMFERVPAHAGRLGYQLNVIGSHDLLPARLVNCAKQAIEATKSGLAAVDHRHGLRRPPGDSRRVPGPRGESGRSWYVRRRDGEAR